MNQYAIILEAFDVVMESRLWKDKKPSEVLNILMYVYSKGWLYTPKVNEKIVAVICAYRIQEVTDDTLNKMPLESKGSILYVPLVVGLNNQENIFEAVRNSLRSFLVENPDIIELVLEGKDDKLRRFKIGAKNGQDQGAGVTSTADVSK